MNLISNNKDWLFFGLTVIFFLLFPTLDLQVAHYFYDSKEGYWLWREQPINVSIYGLYRYLPYLIVPLLLFALVATWIKNGLPRAQRPIWAFLFLSLILGPGILVHSVVKEGFDRPRPKQVDEFGGKSGYTPPLQISDSCERKCRSFVSGHVAMAAWPMVFAWLAGARIWLWSGVIMGLAMGLVRLMQGGHFPSDSIFAIWFCYFVYRALAWWLLGSSRIRSNSE